MIVQNSFSIKLKKNHDMKDAILLLNDFWTRVILNDPYNTEQTLHDLCGMCVLLLLVGKI